METLSLSLTRTHMHAHTCTHTRARTRMHTYTTRLSGMSLLLFLRSFPENRDQPGPCPALDFSSTWLLLSITLKEPTLPFLWGECLEEKACFGSSPVKVTWKVQRGPPSGREWPGLHGVATEQKHFLPRFPKSTFSKRLCDELTTKDQVVSGTVHPLRAVRACFLRADQRGPGLRQCLPASSATEKGVPAPLYSALGSSSGLSLGDTCHVAVHVCVVITRTQNLYVLGLSCSARASAIVCPGAVTRPQSETAAPPHAGLLVRPPRRGDTEGRCLF